jgi:hypothetical protein
MEAVNKTICCKCHGIGSKVNMGGMLGYESKIGENVTCEICSGSGYTGNLYVVEFEFRNAHKFYWMPMLILADNLGKAGEIAHHTRKYIINCFYSVSQTDPVIVLSTLSKWHFQKDFSTHKQYKFAFYNPKLMTVKEPDGKPAIRYNDHLKFKPTNIALLPRTLEYISQKNIYPVRVIKGDTSFDPPEFLILICKRRLDLKSFFSNR